MATKTIYIGDDSIEGIPEEVWKKFKEHAAKQFPSVPVEDAWAHWLSEAIMAIGGGNGKVTSILMTDVPIDNADAVERVLAQAEWTWDQFHAYLLRAAIHPGMVRIINFNDQPQNFGTFIATGLKPETFGKLRFHTGHEPEQVLAAIFDGAAHGSIKFEGTIPPYKSTTTD